MHESISVIGLGYVGAVTSACLAREGRHVIGVDVDELKVRLINSGQSPISEPGLEDLIRGGVAEGRLRATTDYRAAINESSLSIVSVGTPSLASGGLDLSYVRNVCRQLAKTIDTKNGQHDIVLRSTMLPGSTTALVSEYFRAQIDSGKVSVTFCPEFLREGSALADYDSPALIAYGSHDSNSLPRVEETMGTGRWTTYEGAELLKYACNYWHGLKVAFGNEIGRLCDSVGANSRELMQTFCEDTILNISKYYMRPGAPFGGSCLPKDISALLCHARQNAIHLPILENVLGSNAAHIDMLVRKAISAGRRDILVVGLSFKKSTDDLRGSPMVTLCETLIGRGYNVSIFDPEVLPERLIGSNQREINRRMPHLSSRMIRSLGERPTDPCLVVVSHFPTGVEFSDLTATLQDGDVLLDVNRALEPSRIVCGYRTLC